MRSYPSRVIPQENPSLKSCPLAIPTGFTLLLSFRSSTSAAESPPRGIIVRSRRQPSPHSDCSETVASVKESAKGTTLRSSMLESRPITQVGPPSPGKKHPNKIRRMRVGSRRGHATKQASGGVSIRGTGGSPIGAARDSGPSPIAMRRGREWGPRGARRFGRGGEVKGDLGPAG